MALRVELRGIEFGPLRGLAPYCMQAPGFFQMLVIVGPLLYNKTVNVTRLVT